MRLTHYLLWGTAPHLRTVEPSLGNRFALQPAALPAPELQPGDDPNVLL